MSPRRWRLMVTVAAAAVASFLSTSMAGAEIDRIPIGAARLKSMGIDVRRAYVAVISDHGDLLLWIEKTAETSMKAAGKVFMLKTMRVDWATGNAAVQTMWLPTTALDNVALSADGSTAFCIADKGTHFFKVDLPSQTATTVYRGQRDGPGFACFPPVLWFERDRVYCPGYLYDDAGVCTENVLVAIDPAGQGFGAVERLLGMDALMKCAPGGFQREQFFDRSQAYFATLESDRRTHLFYWSPAGLRPIESMVAIGGMAVGDNRVVYCARYDDATRRVVIFDRCSGKKWLLGDPRTVYAYLYMSHDGRSVLVSQFDLHARKFSLFYGRENDGFSLHTVPAIQQVAPGAIRFSGDGSTVSFTNPDGLLLTRLPRR